MSWLRRCERMVDTPTQTVTVNRVSNSGNPIAQQQQAGKTIHVPAGEVGDTYEVRLTDKGGYFVAELVDRTDAVQPRQPSVGPDTSDIGQDLLDPQQNRSHSFDISPSVPGGNLRSSDPAGEELRNRLSRRKK